MIRFGCPSCGKRFQVDEKFAGRKSKCPDCQVVVTIPQVVASAPAINPAAVVAAKVPPPLERTTADRGHSSELSKRPEPRLSAGVKVVIGVGIAFSVVALIATAWILAAKKPTPQTTARPLVATTKPPESIAKGDKNPQVDGQRHPKKPQSTVAANPRSKDATPPASVESEDEKLAKSQRQAEEKQRRAAAAAYRNPPAAARNALNVAKKVGARTEVGINYRDYSTVVGEAWADVKVFAESPEGKTVPDFSGLLVSAIGKYKLALDAWQGKLDRTVQYDEGLTDIVIQECWRAANRRVKVAESLLGGDDVAAGLSQAAIVHRADAEYDKDVRLLFADLIMAHMEREILKLKPDHQEYKNTLKDRIEKMAASVKSLIARDMATE